jgi:hypothetical protein
MPVELPGWKTGDTPIMA